MRVARHELAAARADVETAGAGRLLLNVRDGVRLDVAVERTAPTMFGYSLSGRVAGGGGAGGGFVTLVVHEEAVAGSIWTPSASYELLPLDRGIHALRDVTNAPLVECAGALPSELSAAETVAEDRTDDGSVVDILVVWTPAREEDAGGEPHTLSYIDMSIAFTNDAFERSGALVQLNLVGAERVDYSESGSSRTDLNRLVDPDDGHMDEVHHRWDALGADLVNLQTTGGGGVAQLGGTFSINSIPHEVGHNFGIRHERSELWTNSGLTNSYEHGFTTDAFGRIGKICGITIMSYGLDCFDESRSKVPFYASPRRYLPHDHALGVSRFSKVRGPVARRTRF